MVNFINWCSNNRKPIGYAIGGLDVISGLFAIMSGSMISGVACLAIGVLIVFDAKVFK
jgi:hypothetical protein